MKYIIMAQGAGTRWGDGWKHLAEIGDLPLIERTQYQLQKLGVHPADTTVVGPLEYRSHCLGSYFYTQKNPIGDLLHGMMMTWHLWEDDDVTILLGDVVFSWETLQAILDQKDAILFYGRSGENMYTGDEHGELYAMRFMKELTGQVQWAICRVVAERHRQNMWSLFRHFSGIPLKSARSWGPYLIETGRYDDDLDNKAKYELVYEKINNVVLKEDMAWLSSENDKLKKS